MKQLFSVFGLIVFASLNLVVQTDSSAGMSPDSNEFGIYADPTGDVGSVNIAAIPGVPFHAYLVLTNPVNHSFNGGTDTNVPVTLVAGFECRVIKPGGRDRNWFQISETLPQPSINVGTRPDYVVGYATPLVVAGSAVVLIDWEIMVTDGGAYEWYLDHAAFPTIPGAMVYLDDNDNTVDWSDTPLQRAYPSSGDYLLPVFAVNSQAVSIEDSSWGDVKSLFR